MHSAPRSHLATITPIKPEEARRVMNLPSLLMHNAVFMGCQTGWILLALFSWMFVQLPSEAEKAAGVLGIWLAMMWLACQFVTVFVYPEWPMNRWLSSRLRACVSDRTDRRAWATGAANRVVELVPRERWNQMLLDTATDLMLIRVDSSGVHMEGDRDRYEIPGESILGVELHSIRPTGWFTDTHMVIIYARTENGPIELPISYRDHEFGCLRNSRRREQALALVDEINRIATGGLYGPLGSPNAAESRHPSLPLRDSSISSLNPYAAPSIERD